MARRETRDELYRRWAREMRELSAARGAWKSAWRYVRMGEVRIRNNTERLALSALASR